ncbi:MAG: glucose-6-phosphate dehydrogenase [Parachlamydiaceae bacterium]
MTQSTFVNPLSETHRSFKIAESCILVIFGATGDLTARKLIPALYNLAREGQLPSHFACVGFARRSKTHDEFRDEMLEAINQFSRSKPASPDLWQTFRNQLYYLESNFDDDHGYEQLNQFLLQLDVQLGTKGNRVFYLSVQPSFFTTVVEKLGHHHLIYPSDVKSKWSRIIIEKPFGEDTDSSLKLQQDLLQYLDESQIYRIDHYLGKETVQNLLVFRFGNSIFESVWNNHHIDNIQISVAEEIGIGTRGRFWEEAGMLRDIVQNHMMQLLSLVAMEPPTNLKASSIHDEKVKVLESIRPFPEDRLDEYAVRGQYGAGYINGECVKGYREEENVNMNSFVETYVALQLYIDNWRWAGVPFYLRAGKRMPKRVTEIAITFKKAPGYLFQGSTSHVESNILVIRIQPDEGISFKINCKVPSLNNVIQPVKMDFRYGSYFGSTPPEAYERLICDCMAGDNTLFARDDEVLMSWKLLTPILRHWQATPAYEFPNYAAGTWGPETAEKLLHEQGLHWRLI